MKESFKILVVTLFLAAAARAETITYGFDDGTFEGWEFITPEGEAFPDDSAVFWIASDETIDINDGFDLLEATSGTFRVLPDPWASRDCLGGAFCYTQILRSPEFQLANGEPISVDMMGGGATGDQAFDPDVHLAPESPDDLPEVKDRTGLQGFALLDVELNSYVALGFPSFENDGKARDTDPAHRENWETVSIPQEELADLANNGRSYQVDIFDSYSGGWGWIGFDTVKIPVVSDGVAGDIDGDGDSDTADIDALSTEIRNGSMDLSFDLNTDGNVDASDRSFLVEEINNTYIGDANYDGEFNSSDLVTVFQAGEYEDGVASNSTWASGDWNGDTEFDSGDFVAAFQAGGFEQGPRAVASVPEPSSLCLLAFGCLMIVRRIRR